MKKGARTRSRDKEVYDLYHSGIPVSVIARTLKTSRGSIYNRMKRYEDPVGYYERESKHYQPKRKPQK